VPRVKEKSQEELAAEEEARMFEALKGLVGEKADDDKGDA
jgi:hypothetical protein